jgi:hypothetical protein
VLGATVGVELGVAVGLVLGTVTLGVGVGEATGVDGLVRNQVTPTAKAATNAMMAMSHFCVLFKTITLLE